MNSSIWLLVVPPLLLAVIIHEVAHGWVAKKLGDPTAFLLGRLTLNPAKHIDPIGTIAFPLLQLMASGSVFIAWAKPVPVNISKFKKPLESYAWVAAAGPFSNFVQAAIWAIPLWIVGPHSSGEMLGAFVQMCVIAMQINIALMAFNLIPIPPLDGSRIVAALLPGQMAIQYLRLERITFMLLIMLLFFQRGLLGSIISPVINGVMAFMLPDVWFR